MLEKLVYKVEVHFEVKGYKLQKYKEKSYNRTKSFKKTFNQLDTSASAGVEGQGISANTAFAMNQVRDATVEDETEGAVEKEHECEFQEGRYQVWRHIKTVLSIGDQQITTETNHYFHDTKQDHPIEYYQKLANEYVNLNLKPANEPAVVGNSWSCSETVPATNEMLKLRANSWTDFKQIARDVSDKDILDFYVGKKFMIHHEASGNVMDVKGSRVVKQNNVIWYKRHGGKNQQFTILNTGPGHYSIRPYYNQTYALDLLGHAQKNGSVVVVWPCNDKDNQKLRLVDTMEPDYFRLSFKTIGSKAVAGRGNVIINDVNNNAGDQWLWFELTD